MNLSEGGIKVYSLRLFPRHPCIHHHVQAHSVTLNQEKVREESVINY